MNRPKAFNGGIRQRLNREMIADVGWHCQRLDAQRLDSLSGVRECRFFDIRENNVKAIPREPFG
jgi:hypothetical protein